MDPDTRAIVRRLDQLIVRDAVDGFFNMVTHLANAESGTVRFPVGLLVDGAIIRGTLAPIETLAAALDDGMEQLAPYVFKQPPSNEVRDRVLGIYLTLARQSRDTQKAGRQLLEEKSDFRAVFDELDDVEFRTAMAVAGPLGYVQLVDARLECNGQFHDVGVVRVNVDRIGAWWPLMEEKGVQINFSRAETNDT